MRAQSNKKKKLSGEWRYRWSLEGEKKGTRKTERKKEERQTESESKRWMGERGQQLNMLTTDTHQRDFTELF